MVGNGTGTPPGRDPFPTLFDTMADTASTRRHSIEKCMVGNAQCLKISW